MDTVHVRQVPKAGPERWPAAPLYMQGCQHGQRCNARQFAAAAEKKPALAEPIGVSAAHWHGKDAKHAWSHHGALNFRFLIHFKKKNDLAVGRPA